MKYALLSSVFLYHFEGLLIPLTRASLTMLNHDAKAISLHNLIINSRIGIVYQMVGSQKLKNV